MICSDIQSNLPLHADGFSSPAECASVKAHFDACPLCRQQYSEFRDLRMGLQKMRRPEISAGLRNTIKQNVLAETQKSVWLPVAPDIREWLVMRLMPYGVGVLASLVICMTFLTVLFSAAFEAPTSPIAMRSDPSMMLASNRGSLADYDILISPSDYAQTRLDFASESPSINPQGALIAMTKSLANTGKKNDEVVVVADIYGNGSAQIAEVVEPSRDRQAVAKLEKALYAGSTAAPFVPTTMENRPESVRVILKFQTVEVRPDLKRHKL